MPIQFPSNPSLNQEFTEAGKTWKWNGYAWDAITLTPVGATGPQGATGATGIIPSNTAYVDVNNNFTAGQTISVPANTSALTASYSVTGSNTTQLVSLTGTWNTTGVATALLLNITDTASDFNSRFADFRVNNVTKFSVSKTGVVFGDVYQGGGGSQLWFQANVNGVIVRGGNYFGWGNTSAASADTYIYRDAANIVAQRNVANAQTFRLYGTYTDASNGRRLDITSTTGGIFTLTATGNGTGATGNLLKLTQPILLPASSVTLATNGDLAFEATSNTSLTIRYRGTDGQTRSAILALT